MNKVKQSLLFVLLIRITAYWVNAQNDSLQFFFNNKIKHLRSIAYFAFNVKNEQQRKDSNQIFFNELKSLLQVPESFNFPLDSLKKDISVLTSADHSFRIITWNFPKNDGTHLYYGFIQRWIKKDKKNTPEFRFYVLNDISANIKNNPETYVGTADKWFGMLYYQMIDCKDYSLLLGWDGHEKLIQRKFIDVLYFKSDGTAVFGKDVFKIPKKNPKRIMFQYSTEVVMTLKYDAKKNAIIFAHLSPESNDVYMREQYQFYGPDGSFDAFVKDKDKWKYEEDIDVRNNEGTYTKKPDPKKQKPIYQPK